MQTMRSLLSQEPMTFNDLLDLFEAYVSTVGKPLLKGHTMLREEVGEGEHTALGHIFGVACDAEEMGQRLKHIRSARNTGTDVTLTYNLQDASAIELAATELPYIVEEAGHMCLFLHDALQEHNHNAKGAETGIPAILKLAGRGLLATAKSEGAHVERLSSDLIGKIHRANSAVSASTKPGCAKAEAELEKQA